MNHSIDNQNINNNVNNDNVNNDNVKNNNTKNNIKNDNNVNEYFTELCDTISKKIQPSKKLEKIDTDIIYIPKFN